MSDLFISNLASKLSLDEAEVGRQIERFVDTLIEEIRLDGSVNISDFGRFEFDDDELYFKPDTMLSEAINYRYRSLTPISVAVPGSKEAILKAASEILEANSRDLGADEIMNAGFPEESTSVAAVAETDSVPVSDRSSVEGQPSEKRALVTTPVFWLIPILLIATALVLILKPGSGTPDPVVQNESRVPSTTSEDAVDGRTATEPSQTVQSSLDNLSTDESSIDQVPTGQTPSDPAQDDEARAELLTPDRILAERAQPEIVPQASDRFVSDFERSASGYTLVVGAVSSLSDGESEMRRFSGLSLPLAILEYDANGITRFRLAVGQFETVEDAQLAMRGASGQLPEGTWVRRIRLLN